MRVGLSVRLTARAAVVGLIVSTVLGLVPASSAQVQTKEKRIPYEIIFPLNIADVEQLNKLLLKQFFQLYGFLQPLKM